MCKRVICVYHPLPAYLKKNEESIPCAALLQMRKIVALECPRRISKLSGPANTWGKVISYIACAAISNSYNET
jgi:hypothetical protein